MPKHLYLLWFSLDNKIKRKTLMDFEIKLEVAALKEASFDHVLLVAGEANYTVNINYFLNAIDVIKDQFSIISIEVQPLSQEEYERLHEAGVYSVLVYQETYHQDVYKSIILRARNPILILDWILRPHW
jgi:2-iminoacetate synthase